MDIRDERQTEAGAPGAERGQPPEYSLTGEAIRQDQIRDGGVGTAPSPQDGMRRYPTEPPGGEGGGVPWHRWSALGWAGAGAGLASLLMLALRRSRGVRS